MSHPSPFILLFLIGLTNILIFPIPVFSTESPAVDSSVLGPAIQEELDFIAEETVVTASQYKQPISKAPSNIYVITAQDIRNSGALFIPTLLRRVPGMEVIQMTGEDFNVSVRGNNQLRANKLLMMVDGRSNFFDAQGGVGWTQLPITLPEIERIEVLKGPASAVYGFNAFDGVVNIITKRPQDLPHALVQIGGGEFGSLQASGIHAGQIEELSYKLSIGHTQVAQWRNRDSLAHRTYLLNGKASYPVASNYTVFAEGGISDKNRADFASAEVFRVNSSTVKSYARIGIEKENFFLRAFWNQFDVESANTPLIPFLSVTDPAGNAQGLTILSNSYDIASQYGTTIFTNHRVTTGANYRLNTISGSFVMRNDTEHRFGVYLQDEWQPLKYLAINAGGRIDLHNEIHPTYSPRIALLLFPHPDHTIRFSGSLAYRPPTMLDANIVTLTSTIGLGPTTSTTTTTGTSKPRTRANHFL